jgi:hypothetical protein
MKILNPLRFIKGAGGSKPPVPALVPPPDKQNLKKSISIYECVDLICEGPIYGLVDQYGKKVYGLDMLKGIYLNGNAVMNYKGEYNYRNVMMEINFGTENQKPLVNFKNVHIAKPANFKLLGPITPNPQPDELRINPNKDQPTRDFVKWAINSEGWPDKAQDPYLFIHKIKNRDVKKLKVSLIVEALMDTVSEGTGPGEAGKMGMSKSSSLDLIFKWGVEGSSVYSSKRIPISGLVQSPWAYMIGNGSTSYTQAPSTYSAGASSSNPFANGGNGAAISVNYSSNSFPEIRVHSAADVIIYNEFQT